jgi:aquaporin Z
MNTGKAAVAEFFGTFWLVFGGVGAAVLAGKVGASGIGWLGVALAFGLTVVTMAYAVGHISGGHFNPAVTIGLWAGGRFPGGKVLVYVVAQVAGGIAAAAVLYAIAVGKHGFSLADGFGSNGYGLHSPAHYNLTSAIIIELLLTFAFLLVIHGVTDRRAPAGLAPLAIGLALALIHLIAIPVDGTSVNPARSLAPALFVGGWALAQLWVFIVFPIIGAVVGGLAYRFLLEVPVSERDRVEGPGESAEEA